MLKTDGQQLEGAKARLLKMGQRINRSSNMRDESMDQVNVNAPPSYEYDLRSMLIVNPKSNDYYDRKNA